MPSEINKLLCFLWLLASAALSAQPVLSLSGPDQIKIGTSTIVKVLIDKTKNLDGPARLEMIIPDNWTIENYPGEVASFKQQGNKATIVWLEFPTRDSLSVTAMLKLPSKAETGQFMVSATFDYFENDQPRKLRANPKKITISRYFSRF